MLSNEQYPIHKQSGGKKIYPAASAVFFSRVFRWRMSSLLEGWVGHPHALFSALLQSSRFFLVRKQVQRLSSAHVNRVEQKEVSSFGRSLIGLIRQLGCVVDPFLPLSLHIFNFSLPTSTVPINTRKGFNQFPSKDACETNVSSTTY